MSVEFDFAKRTDLEEPNLYPFIAVDFSQRIMGKNKSGFSRKMTDLHPAILAKAKTL